MMIQNLIRLLQNNTKTDKSIMLFHQTNIDRYKTVLNVLSIGIRHEEFNKQSMNLYWQFNIIYLDSDIDNIWIYAKQLIKNKNSVVFMDLNFKVELLKNYYIRYFYNKGIDTDKEILKVCDWRILNPFISSDQYLKCVVNDLGDIILPYLFNDFTMIREGPYELSNINIQEGNVVFDCGANIGLFSTLCLARKCKVYAFEPSSANIIFLKKNLSLYNDDYQIVNVALSNVNAKGKLYISSKNNEANSLIKSNWHDEFEHTNLMTLDTFVSQYSIHIVNFIKMDVEGYEKNVINGARNLLNTYKPKMSICIYHNPNDIIEIPELIKQIKPSYRINHRYEKIYCYEGAI